MSVRVSWSRSGTGVGGACSSGRLHPSVRVSSRARNWAEDPGNISESSFSVGDLEREEEGRGRIDSSGKLCVHVA